MTSIMGENQSNWSFTLFSFSLFYYPTVVFFVMPCILTGVRIILKMSLIMYQIQSSQAGQKYIFMSTWCMYVTWAQPQWFLGRACCHMSHLPISRISRKPWYLGTKPAITCLLYKYFCKKGIFLCTKKSIFVNVTLW